MYIFALFLLFTVLWGLDEEGKFLTNFVEKPHGISGRLKALFYKQEEVNVKEAVLMDLKRIHDSVRTEAAALKHADATKHEIGKKLLFLFQCDLLPGISGKILDLKGSRDGANVPHVTRRSKIMAWTFLFLMDTGMLFYIFLFALTQTGPRQNAWFQSFALWLVVEILLVSTAIVFFTHILIPSLIMKDLSQIKRRLMDNIRDFNEKVQENKTQANAAAMVKGDRNDVAAPFNAADYLFVSTRLAKQFPDLKEAKIISHFSTPWPRQSYLRVSNVSKKYSKKFSALTRSASILIIFFVSNFISVPPSLQDVMVQITSTTAIGYVLYIHVQLYAIFPVLVILPTLLVLVLVHFIIQSSKSDAQLKLARLFPHTNKKSKMTTFTPEGAIVVEEEAKNIDPEDENDSDFDSISEESGPVALPVQAHRTRRQSIGVGLDVIQALQNRVHRAGSSVGDEVSSELTMSTDSAIDENEIELLHRPAGVQYAAPRIVTRGVPLLRRQSRMSSYSIDLSIPSNGECDDTGSASEDEDGDDDSSVSSSSRSSAGESDSESSHGDQDDDDEGSNLGSSDDYSDSEGEAEEEEEGKEAVGELTAVLQDLTLPDARSLSTISNQVPLYVRNQSRASEYSSSNDDSAAESVPPPRAPAVYTIPPLSFPPILSASSVLQSEALRTAEQHADDRCESTHSSDSNSDAESGNLRSKFALFDTGSVGQESIAHVKDFYSETASSASSQNECASFQAIPPPPVRTASQRAEISAGQGNDNAGSDESSGRDSSSDEGAADTDVPVAVRRPKPFNMTFLAAHRTSQRQRLPSISEYQSASDDSSDTGLVAEEDAKASSLVITDTPQLVTGQQIGDEGKQSDEESSTRSDSGEDDAVQVAAPVPVIQDAVSDNDDSYESVSSASNEHDVDADRFYAITVVPTSMDSAVPTSKEVLTNSVEAQQPPVTFGATVNTSANADNKSQATASKVSSTTKSIVTTKRSTTGAKQNGSPRTAARKNSTNTGSYTAPTRTTLVRQAEPERNFQVKMATFLKKTPSKK